MRIFFLLFLFLSFTSFGFSQEEMPTDTPPEEGVTDEVEDEISESLPFTTYYLIRHAEKDRSDPNNKNPNLTQDGLLRAAKWALALGNIKFDAVYSTDYNRTRETAQPAAEMNGVEITLYDPRDMSIKSFMEATAGKNILVVGHSNTTPKFANWLLGEEKYDQIADNNNSNLYIISISPKGERHSQLIVID